MNWPGSGQTVGLGLKEVGQLEDTSQFLPCGLGAITGSITNSHCFASRSARHNKGWSILQIRRMLYEYMPDVIVGPIGSIVIDNRGSVPHHVLSGA